MRVVSIFLSNSGQKECFPKFRTVPLKLFNSPRTFFRWNMNVFYDSSALLLHACPYGIFQNFRVTTKIFISLFKKIDLYVPSGFVNSLNVAKEMKVWDTECVGSRTQATSLAWQDFIQRMVSERSSLATLKERTNIHTQNKKKTQIHTWPLTFR